MKCYPKIETVYRRDMEGSKKLIEGDFRNKTVKMLADFPIWYGTEKLDGTNMQIAWDGHKLTLGGRTENTNIPPHILEYYNSTFNNNETEEIFEQVFGDKPMVLFFEAVGPKIQTFGKHYSDSVKFILLDVYNVNNDSWWPFDGIVDVAIALRVEHKICVCEGSIKDIIGFVKTVPMSSQSAHPLPIEGVVAVPKVELKDANGERVIVKIKCCDHCENFSSLMKQYR